MARAISLFIFLLILWLLLSGIYEPLLIILGVVSCAFVAFIAYRMDVVDHEGHPVHLTWRFVIYMPWLAWEIVKSNFAVAKIIVDPRLPISPRVIKVRASQPDELGHVIYANSITLTPGTVSINLQGDDVEVHALAAEFAEGVESGDMNRRVTRVSGGG